jgi:SAM-dependent methyltransferase
MQEVEQLDNYVKSYTSEFPYSEENYLMLAAYGERLAQYIQKHEVGSALSLGIGYVEVARRLLAELASGVLERYVVVDGAPQIIADFRRSIDIMPDGLELIEGYFETFTAPGRFDVIEAGFILEHVDEPSFVLNRLHQFLAPGGRIFIAVPNACSLHRLIGHKAGLLEDMYALSPSDLALGHKRYFDLQTLSGLVRDTGFKIGKVEGLFLKPFTTSQLSSLDLSPAIWQALLEVSTGYPEISNAIYIEVTA